MPNVTPTSPVKKNVLHSKTIIFGTVLIGAFYVGINVGFLIANWMYEPQELISPIPASEVLVPSPTPTPEIVPVATESAKPAQTWEGKASYYSREGCLGCSPTMTMANGEPLDDGRLTLAFNDLPMNSKVEIENVDTGHTVIATVTDTGGFKRHGKIADLTIATRDAISCKSTCSVKIKKYE